MVAHRFGPISVCISYIFVQHCLVVATSFKMARPTAVEVEVVAFGAVTGTRSRTSLAVLGPTYSLAVEDLQRKYNESLHFTYSEPGARTCLTVVSKSSEFLADYYYRQERLGKVFVFVHGGGEMPGFPCSNGDFPTAAVLSLTSFWNSLTLNTITGIDLTRENLLPMLSTVLSLAQNPAEKHVNVIVSLLRQYAWKTIFIVHDKISGNPQDIFVQSYGPMMKQVGLLMLAAPRNELGVPTFHEMRSNDDDSCSDTLAKFQSVSRVMLFGGSEGIRKLMLAARLQNMTDGSYVYITVDMWPEAPNQFWSSWYRPDITDHAEVYAATEAFRSVLTISRYYDGDFLKTNRSMDLFREFRRRTNTMYNITADEFTPDPAPIIGNLIGSYNALMIVGETIQKAWEDGDDLTDGRGLRRRLLNRTISTEFDRVYIDSYGQRIPDFSVSSFSPGSLDRTVFLLYRGGFPFLEPLILRPVSWPGIWPVPNEPVCGYRGVRCGISQLSNLGGLAGGVVTSLLLVMIAGCLLFVRHYHKLKLARSWNRWYIEHRLLGTIPVTSNFMS